MTIKLPGIYTEYPVEDYFADPCPTPSLTQSLVKIMLEYSPLHAWVAHPRNPKSEKRVQVYDREMAIGNAYHLLVSERGKKLRLINEQNFLTKAAKEQRDAAWACGEEPILQKHWTVAYEMAVEAAKHLKALKLDPAKGDGEVVLAWEDEGIWCRSLVDWLSTDRLTVVDYKTSMMSCAPHCVSAKMATDGFAIQAAFQARGLDLIDPATAGRRQHLFVCQEQKPPYAVTIARISEAVMYLGRRQVDWGIRKWRHCILADDFIGYPTAIIEPEMPAWAEQRWMEREENEYEYANPIHAIRGV